jgi:alkylhydroperoxidase/carboxymuconolactone decarboxylase family protein YurZ
MRASLTPDALLGIAADPRNRMGLDVAGENDEALGYEYAFPYEQALHEVAPALHEAQSAWLSAIDSVPHLDRKTHELIRMVCTAVLRYGEGVERHARLAAEAGAEWGELVSALALTTPAFGLTPLTDGLRHMRAGFESAEPVEDD